MLKQTHKLPYDQYIKLQDCYAPFGDELNKPVRKVKLSKLPTDKGELLCCVTGSLHSNMFESHITTYLFTPIDDWDKPIREKFTGERWKPEDYIGLVFTCRNKEYVISGAANIEIDFTKTNFETSISKVKEYEENYCSSGMGWRARYYNCKRPVTSSLGKAVYSYYEGTEERKGMFITYVHTKKGLVDFYLGNSPDCVEKLSSLLNEAKTLSETLEVQESFTLEVQEPLIQEVQESLTSVNKTEKTNTLVANELQKSLMCLLIGIINKFNDDSIIQKLESNGKSIIAQAFEQTKIFSLRKYMSQQYKAYFDCMNTIDPKALIVQMKSMTKQEFNHATY